ncbi:hypothetical protein Tco_0658029 [Tanacetum coccineum]
MPELPSTSSSLFVSSGFGNQFLNLSSDISLIQSPTLLNVPVSVIPKQPVPASSSALTTETHVSTILSHPPSVTTITPVQQQKTPIPTPPITTIAPSVTTAVRDLLLAIVQRLSVLESQFEEWKQVDHSEAIEDLVQVNIINEKNQTFPVQSSVTPVQLAYRAAESISKLELKNILFAKMDKSRSYLTHDKHQELFNSLLNFIMIDEAIAKGDVNLDKVLKKRDSGDDEDEDPFTRPNQGNKTKRRRTKESESSKNSSTSKDTSKGNTPPKTSKSNKSVHVEESVAKSSEETNTFSKHNWFTQPPRPPTLDPEWNKVKAVDELKNKLDLMICDQCPFDLNKPLPLKGHPCHLTVAAEYFFNNDLEYLKSTYSERKYTTSITKTKAERYELVGIEDMISKQWSATKVGYDKDVKHRIKHWGPKHKLFYRSQLNRFSKHDVYSPLKILSVFKEGDFVNLHLNDIEDIILLVVQHKLFHLNGDVIFDLAVALHMFTRSLIIKKRVEDVQLADELYKFSDGTLKSVHETLHHMLLNFRLGYNNDMPRRKWPATDQRRSGIMDDLIDKKLLERQTIKNLERLVGARELEMDYRLMQRTIVTMDSVMQCTTNIRVILHSIHSDDGNPTSANIKQALRQVFLMVAAASLR